MADWENLKGKPYNISVGKTSTEALDSSTDPSEICFTKDGNIIFNGVKYVPTPQVGTNGTSSNYVYSVQSTSDKAHNVLSGTFKVYQYNGKIRVTHKLWGSTTDYADGMYYSADFPTVNSGADGAMDHYVHARLLNHTLTEGNSTTNSVLVNYTNFSASGNKTLTLTAATSAKAGVMTVDHVNALAQAQTDVSDITSRLVCIAGQTNHVTLSELDDLSTKRDQGWYRISDADKFGHVLVSVLPTCGYVTQLLFGAYTIKDGVLSGEHNHENNTILIRTFSELKNGQQSWSEWRYYQQTFLKTDNSVKDDGEAWTYGHTKIDNIVSNLNSFSIDQGERAENLVNINYTNPADGTTKSFSINQATSAKAGLMGTTHLLHLNQAYSGVTALNKHYKNLGNFDSESKALAKLGEIAICSDAELLHAHMTYTDGGSNASIILVQSVHGNYCRQVIFNKDKIFQRGITFTDENRTAISLNEDWGYLLADRLQWSTSGRKYVLSQFGQGFNHGITDPVPLATSSVDGLMSKEDKAFLDSLKSKTQSEE